MSTLALAFPEIDAHAQADLKIEMLAADQTIHPRFNQPFAGFVVDPYTVESGFPVEDSGYGVSSVSSASVTGVITGVGSISPSAVSTGSDYRWLPTAATVSGGQWTSLQGGIYPYIGFHNRLNAVNDPVLSPNYSYVHHSARVSNAAVSFLGNGYGQLYTSSDNTAVVQTMTFCYVLVPRPGDGPFWSLFDTGAGQNSATQLNLRYRKGAFQVYTGGLVESRQLEYECHLRSGEPVVLMLAYDLANHQVRFSVYDRRRTAKTYYIQNVTGIIPNSLLGMSVTSGGAPDYSKSPVFELLEIDIWNRALSFVEIEQVLSLLSSVFQAGP